ncbi:uncharacterized protein TNCV_1849241 [Trichonephila clavipes]|nr:uncharacterized protein TNCV_1849241 [Trichonephila clavipes]
MEDSGIESDCKTVLLRIHNPYIPIPRQEEQEDKDTMNDDSETPKPPSSPSIDNEEGAVCFKAPSKVTTKHKGTSVLQKRLEKQILQSRKLRQREQNSEGMQKKLIPRRPGFESNPGKGMNVCKCIVPLWHGDTLISCQAASPLGRLMEE